MYKVLFLYILYTHGQVFRGLVYTYIIYFDARGLEGLKRVSRRRRGFRRWRRTRQSSKKIRPYAHLSPLRLHANVRSYVSFYIYVSLYFTYTYASRTRTLYIIFYANFSLLRSESKYNNIGQSKKMKNFCSKKFYHEPDLKSLIKDKVFAKKKN